MGVAGRQEGVHVDVDGWLLVLVLLLLVALVVGVVVVVVVVVCVCLQGHEQQCVVRMGNHTTTAALLPATAVAQR